MENRLYIDAIILKLTNARATISARPRDCSVHQSVFVVCFYLTAKGLFIFIKYSFNLFLCSIESVGFVMIPLNLSCANWASVTLYKLKMNNSVNSISHNVFLLRAKILPFVKNSFFSRKCMWNPYKTYIISFIKHEII